MQAQRIACGGCVEQKSRPAFCSQGTECPSLGRYTAYEFFNSKEAIAASLQERLQAYFRAHLHAEVASLQIQSCRLPDEFNLVCPPLPPDSLHSLASCDSGPTADIGGLVGNCIVFRVDPAMIPPCTP